jgi:predicted methyltransferase MtxX (methanogen marker protein 4)
MHHIIGALVVGAIGGGAAGDSGRRRSIAGKLIKGGIVAKRRIEAAGAAALSETKKLVEEARTELDQAEGEIQN